MGNDLGTCLKCMLLSKTSFIEHKGDINKIYVLVYKCRYKPDVLMYTLWHKEHYLVPRSDLN